ncbi:MAG: hypothetical protein H6815_08165 [Phycisphaeraceae bacterium]|nr:hypothetical protein [Phycisphaerales bacterium]MCB9860415.1 hypothetical protein [Phycisphaeraceae bacterium]
MQNAPEKYPAHTAEQPASLTGVLGITALGSLSTGIVTNGVFFIANSQFDYGHGDQWKTGLLGLVMGITYIPAAFFAHEILEYAQRFRLSARACLLIVTVLMSAMCVATGLYYAGDHNQEWPMFLFAGMYNIPLGVLWPTVESYLTGGRTKAQLKRTTGKFNFTWAGTLIAGLLLIAPLIKQAPTASFWIVGLSNLFVVPFVLMLPKHPAHGLANDDVAPNMPADVVANERKLLVVFRFQLFASYIVASAISAVLPFVLDRLHVAKNWHTPAESIWAATRIGPFVLMGIWAGWHGKWSVPWVAAALLMGGFVLSVLSPELMRLGLSETTAVIMLVAALSLLGIGIGIIYTAALNYAMEVGSAKVEAAGKHEALIGCGIAIGPACVIVASLCEHVIRSPTALAPDEHATPSGIFVWTAIGLVLLIVSTLLGLGLRSARKNRVTDLETTPLHTV